MINSTRLFPFLWIFRLHAGRGWKQGYFTVITTHSKKSPQFIFVTVGHHLSKHNGIKGCSKLFWIMHLLYILDLFFVAYNTKSQVVCVKTMANQSVGGSYSKSNQLSWSQKCFCDMDICRSVSTTNKIDMKYRRIRLLGACA